jgi:2-isopropylmalate synthase
LVGAEKSEIVLTARSGRHGLRHRLRELGYDFGDDRFERVYEDFLRVADTKSEVTDDDLEVLVSR